MNKIEHLGIAVRNLEAACARYENLLGKPAYKTETVEREGVRTAFFAAGPNKIELLEPTRPESAIAKFLAKKGEGLHHVAYAVSDIKEELVRLRKAGYRILNEEPQKGADNKWVAFVHPKDTNGVLTELCQERD